MYLILAVLEWQNSLRRQFLYNSDTEVCEVDRCHTPFIFLFHSDYYHCFVVFFPLFFSLVYFCLVCAIVIMGSQPQMSLALPCRALRRTLRRWGLYHTAGPAGGQRSGTPKGGSPRGQAEGDNYPKHCSVDQGKIFILLSPHQTSR